jgi:hypothetical protein
MSDGLNNTLEYKMDDNEYCYIMCKPPRIDSTTDPKQVFVPVFMADPENPEDIPGIPEEWEIKLDNSIYCNDTPCKPVVDPLIYGRNYVNVYHHANDWFHHRWLNRGARVLLEIHNKDMDHMRIIDHEDPSYCDDCSIEHPECPWAASRSAGVYTPQ